MGHFKHVSAFCWVPECRVWAIYDVSFRRTRFAFLPDTPESKKLLTDVITGNCMVTMTAREDAFPVIRCGLYCTTAIKHLLGLRGMALRPDALYRLMKSAGGIVSDDRGALRGTPVKPSSLNENHRSSSTGRTASANGRS